MMGKRHVPTDEQRKYVEAMAGFGISEYDIARVIGTDHNTLRKHYRDELDLGAVKANTAVAKNLFRMATGEGREAVTAAIFWLKTRARWSEYAALTAPAPGKKEQAQAHAEKAHEGNQWSSLIN